MKTYIYMYICPLYTVEITVDQYEPLVSTCTCIQVTHNCYKSISSSSRLGLLFFPPFPPPLSSSSPSFPSLPSPRSLSLLPSSNRDISSVHVIGNCRSDEILVIVDNNKSLNNILIHNTINDKKDQN